MQNVINVKKLPKIKKKIITFDKKGNRKEQIVEKDDLFSVTLMTGDVIALNEKQMKFYGIEFEEDLSKSVQEIVNSDDDSDNLVNINTQSVPNITNIEQVINSPTNEG